MHPAAPEHLPYFIPGADGSDPMFSNMIIFLLVMVVLIGVAYLHLHSLPERMAHKQNSTQLQMIAILAVLALFTHNNVLWVMAILLAVVRPPDLVTPLNSIAHSLQEFLRDTRASGAPRDTRPLSGEPLDPVDEMLVDYPESVDSDSVDGDKLPDASTSESKE